MSEERRTVYVRLLGEGVDVWRSVLATVLPNGRFRLEGPEDYQPELETWEFPPGTMVRCEVGLTSGEPTLVAVSVANNARGRVGGK